MRYPAERSGVWHCTAPRRWGGLFATAAALEEAAVGHTQREEEEGGGLTLLDFFREKY